MANFDNFKHVPKWLQVNVKPGGKVKRGLIAFKAAGDRVVKVLITKAGLRPLHNLGGLRYDGKFRVREVMVVGIIDEGGIYHDTAYTRNACTYRVGELVSPNGFSRSLKEDCGQGIHLFSTFDKAAKLAGWSGY